MTHKSSHIIIQLRKAIKAAEEELAKANELLEALEAEEE